MFAEPAVTEIEEVVGLIQEDIRTGSGSDGVAFQTPRSDPVATTTPARLPRWGPRSAPGSDKELVSDPYTPIAERSRAGYRRVPPDARVWSSVCRCALSPREQFARPDVSRAGDKDRLSCAPFPRQD